MPTRDHLVRPSPDTHTPVLPEPSDAATAIALALMDELKIPRRLKFTPSQLAEDVGGTARSWQRECALGNIGAIHVAGGWIVPYDRLVQYIAKRQNIVISKN